MLCSSSQLSFSPQLTPMRYSSESSFHCFGSSCIYSLCISSTGMKCSPLLNFPSICYLISFCSYLNFICSYLYFMCTYLVSICTSLNSICSYLNFPFLFSQFHLLLAKASTAAVASPRATPRPPSGSESSVAPQYRDRPLFIYFDETKIVYLIVFFVIFVRSFGTPMLQIHNFNLLKIPIFRIYKLFSHIL